MIYTMVGGAIAIIIMIVIFYKAYKNLRILSKEYGIDIRNLGKEYHASHDLDFRYKYKYIIKRYYIGVAFWILYVVLHLIGFIKIHI
jgi:hypothetical protein